MRSPGLRWALLSLTILAVCSGCGKRDLAAAPTPRILAPELLHTDGSSTDRAFSDDLRREREIVMRSDDAWTVTPFSVPSDGDPAEFKKLQSRSAERLAKWESDSAALISSSHLKFVREEPVEDVVPQDAAKIRQGREHIQNVQQKYSEKLLGAELRVTSLKASIAAVDDEHERNVQSARLDEADASLRKIEAARDQEIAQKVDLLPENRISPPLSPMPDQQMSVKAPTARIVRRTTVHRGSSVKPIERRKIDGSVPPVRVAQSAEYRDRLADMGESIDKAIDGLSRNRSMRKVK